MVSAARSQWGTVLRQAHHCFTFTINYLLQGRLSPNSCHAVLAFILPLLVAFLALKYVGKVVTPFETHPKTMQFAIGSLLVYCLAYGAQLSVQSSIYLNAFGRFMELFGCPWRLWHRSFFQIQHSGRFLLLAPFSGRATSCTVLSKWCGSGCIGQ